MRVFLLNLFMEYRKKIFINKKITYEESELIATLFLDLNLKDYLKDSFMYVELDAFGGIEIVTVKDDDVFNFADYLKVSNELAVIYVKNKNEIEQKLKETLYWTGINDLKKYVPVTSEIEGNKEYAKFNVYEQNVALAVKSLFDMKYDEFIYLEDVDEEI